MPPPSNPNLTALWLTDPKAAARQVIDALESTRTLPEAAKKLNVGLRTLARWLKEKKQLQEGGG
jgi:phage antirepressor YoqD-like protein